MRETLARHDGLADFAFAMQGLGAGAISFFGTAAQREWLKRTRAGTAIAAFALSEPRSGSDVAGIETTARRDGGDYILDGEKPGFRTAASPISMWSSPVPAKGRARRAFRPLSFLRTSPASRRRTHRGDGAAPACTHQIRGGACPGIDDDRRAGRGLQDRHGDARRLPHDGRSGRARLRPQGARRDDQAGPRTPTVRRAAVRPADGAGAYCRHGARRRRGGAVGLPRRLDQGQRRRSASPARPRWPSCSPPTARRT